MWMGAWNFGRRRPVCEPYSMNTTKVLRKKSRKSRTFFSSFDLCPSDINSFVNSTSRRDRERKQRRHMRLSRSAANAEPFSFSSCVSWNIPLKATMENIVRPGYYCPLLSSRVKSVTLSRKGPLGIYLSDCRLEYVWMYCNLSLSFGFGNNTAFLPVPAERIGWFARSPFECPCKDWICFNMMDLKACEDKRDLISISTRFFFNTTQFQHILSTYVSQHISTPLSLNDYCSC